MYEVKERVANFLTGQVGPVTRHENGALTFPQGSATISVSVLPLDGSFCIVEISSETNAAVPPSAGLYEFISLGAGAELPFVSTRLKHTERGLTVLVYHRLLGDFLDLDELRWAIHSVAQQADDLDDLVHESFGGDPPRES